MRPTAIFVLVASAILLMLYPFWGLLHPQSYEAELAAHYAFAEGVRPHQVQRSAAMVWAPNGILASCFVCLAGFVANPARTLHARWAGGCLIAYPFVRTAIEAWSGLNLTSHAPDAEVTVVFSSDKLLFLVMGLALFGIASTVGTALENRAASAEEEPHRE